MGLKKIIEGAYLVPMDSANAVLLDGVRPRFSGEASAC